MKFARRRAMIGALMFHAMNVWATTIDVNKKLQPSAGIVSGANWTAKFSAVCSKANIPCGIEESPEDPISKDSSTLDEGIPGDTAAATIRQILDAIVKLHPSYRWKIDNGVINILPVVGKESTVGDMPRLDRRIKSLKAKNQPAWGIAYSLCQKADILRTPESPEPHPQEMAGPIQFNPRKISVKLKNVTVREGLNEVVRVDGQAIWKFFFDSNMGEYAVDIRVWGRSTMWPQ